MLLLSLNFNPWCWFESLHDDFAEDPGSSAHIVSTMTRQLVWHTLTISTLIGLFDVLPAQTGNFQSQ